MNKIVKLKVIHTMPRCPYQNCGEWFQSNKGLEIHITKKHTYIDPFGNRIIRPIDVNPFGEIRDKDRSRWFF